MHTQFNKDIKDYKENFWKGLTRRQAIFGGLSVASIVIFKIIMAIWFEGWMLNFFGYAFAFLFAFLGFFRKDRLNAEEFALLFLRYRKTPKVLNCINKPIEIIPANPEVTTNTEKEEAK